MTTDEFKKRYLEMAEEQFREWKAENAVSLPNAREAFLDALFRGSRINLSLVDEQKS